RSTPARRAGRCCFYVSGIFAEIERDRIRERQREGNERRKAEGGYRGRPPSFDATEIRRLAATGLPKSKIARQLGCHRSCIAYWKTRVQAHKQVAARRYAPTHSLAPGLRPYERERTTLPRRA